MVLFPEAVVVAILSIFLFVTLCSALVLIVLSLRTPANATLIAASALVLLSLVVVAVAPVNVPTIVGLMIALLGTALAVLGGDPITRRILTIATRGSVRDGVSGGILVSASEDGADASIAEAGDQPTMREVMRGGTTIGYLERTSAIAAMIAGFAPALAIIVAIKGVGRFSELEAPEARERFIIGTMSSLLWASAVGGLVYLAIW